MYIKNGRAFYSHQTTERESTTSLSKAETLILKQRKMQKHSFKQAETSYLYIQAKDAIFYHHPYRNITRPTAE
jgi:hypothetical protein